MDFVLKVALFQLFGNALYFGKMVGFVQEVLIVSRYTVLYTGARLFGNTS